ncbi:MAG: hypothetical protein K8T10_01695 [Candidatus Eremiobacteraeota bacterium]|nr:hypothetical protein [Candidatus Eremiobacteraeota bacterium]
MEKNYSIGSIKNIKRKKAESMQGVGASVAAQGAYQPSAMQSGTETSKKGDSVHLSDEIKATRSIGSGGNIDSLKGEITRIKEQLNVKPSGKDASTKLAQGSMEAQMEKNGLQAAHPQMQLGMNPGMHNGGVKGIKGIGGGLESGMKVGGTYSSRYSSKMGYEPGGGRVSSKMHKLQAGYAQALKAGHGINSTANNMVLNTFSQSGKTAKPIRHMLGLQKN